MDQKSLRDIEFIRIMQEKRASFSEGPEKCKMKGPL